MNRAAVLIGFRRLQLNWLFTYRAGWFAITSLHACQVGYGYAVGIMNGQDCLGESQPSDVGRAELLGSGTTLTTVYTLGGKLQASKYAKMRAARYSYEKYSLRGIEKAPQDVLFLVNIAPRGRIVKPTPDDRILPTFDKNLTLEDRMRELCQQLATSPDECDLDTIRQELLCLSHERLSRSRKMPIELPEGKFLSNRRVSRC